MTRDEAYDMIMGHVAAALPPGIPALWPDTPQSIPAGAQWVRPVIRHATGGQASLGNAMGARRFNHGGVLIVQLFTPVGDGMTDANTLAQAFLTYFEAVRSSQVWYRNIRAMEIGKDGAAEQVNFLADFSYDHIH
jgi:hypothetical protein